MRVIKLDGVIKLGGIDVPEVNFEEWQGLPWPIWRYAIAPPRNQAAGWTGGLFMKRPADGELTMYRPTEKAVPLLRAALAVKAEDETSLLAFVNAWGTLGVGLGTQEETMELLRRPSGRGGNDSVWATRRAFLSLQASFRWLRALQARKWSSPDIPDLAAMAAPVTAADPEARTVARRRALIALARAIVAPPDHGPLGLDADPTRLDVVHVVDRVASFGHEEPYLSAALQGHRFATLARQDPRASRFAADPELHPELHWHAFAAALTPHLRTVHPMIRWHPDGRSVPAFRVRRPIDAAWVALWNWATEGAQLRRCRHRLCREWFSVDRPGKIYCSPECANRASSKAWYEAKGRRLRRAQRRESRRDGLK